MEEIDYLEQRIDSIKDRVRNFEFIDNGLEDKRNMMYIMSELAKAQKDKTKLLIKQKKLLDTRSFGRKEWDFVKEDPMTALFILLILLLALVLVFAACLYIYNHGFIESLKDFGKFLCGMAGILFVIGILYSITMLKKL